MSIRRYTTLCFIAAVVFISTVAHGAAVRFRSPQIALPLSPKPPTVDGAIHEDEWSYAARIVGMVRVGGTALTPRRAVSWLTCDGKRVYFAVKSEMPPSGKLVANLKPSADDLDAPTIKDDSVEVWLAPHRRASIQGVYQAIFNLHCAVFDRQYDPPRDWRGDWRLGSKVVEGWWNFEGSVSLASLGVKESPVGKAWNVRLVRNWKKPWVQSGWAPLAAHFEERDTMAVVRWLKEAPITQMVSNRSPDGKKALYRLRIHNPHAHQLAAHCRIDSQPTDSQHAYLDETYQLPAGGAREVVLDHSACKPEEKIYTRIHISSPDDSQVHFHREFNWRLARPKDAWRETDDELDSLGHLEKALTFHASFDNGPDANIALGEKTSKSFSQNDAAFRQVEGLSGKAMLSGKGCASVAYANDKNFNIHQGTLSLWIQTLDWKGTGKGDNNHPLFTNGVAGKGYFGVQMARQVSPGPYLCFYMIQYPWRKTAAIFATDEVPTWRPGAWHWIVLTWRADEVTLYVDGQARGRRTFEPPLDQRDLTWPTFRIGKSGGEEQTAIDEVMLFDRCLSPSELRMAKAFCRSSAPDAWDAVDLKFAYYPYHCKLKAQVDINALKGREKVSAATLVVRRIGEPKPIETIRMPPFEKNVSEAIADLPDLPDGKYQLALRLDPAPRSSKASCFVDSRGVGSSGSTIRLA